MTVELNTKLEATLGISSEPDGGGKLYTRGITPVISVGDNTPPVAPSIRTRYVVGPVPTGIWIGRANALAYYNSDGSWSFGTPSATFSAGSGHGWMVFNLTDSLYYGWNGDEWATVGDVSGVTADLGALQSQVDALSAFTNTAVDTLGDGVFAAQGDADAAQASADALELFLSVGTPSTVLDLYWDPVSGSDANDGLSTVAPIQTFARLLVLLPGRITRPVLVHCSSGSFVFSAPLPSLWGQEKMLVFICDGCAIEGGWDPRSNARTSVGAGTAASGTGANQCVTALATSADQFQGYTIRFTSGAALGQRRTIYQHPVGAVFPDLAWSPAPASGDTFEIYNSTAVIDGGVLTRENPGRSSSIVGAFGETVGVSFVGFDVDSTVGGSTKVFGAGFHLLYGVRFRSGVGSIVLKGGGWEMGNSNTTQLTDQLALPQSLWGGWGVTVESTGTGLTTRDMGTYVDGFIVSKGNFVSMRGAVLLRGGCVRNMGLNFKACDYSLSGPSAQLPFIVGGVAVAGTVFGGINSSNVRGYANLANTQIRNNGTGAAAMLIQEEQVVHIASTVVQGSLAIGNTNVDNPSTGRTVEVSRGGALYVAGAMALGRSGATDIFVEATGIERSALTASGATSQVVDPTFARSIIRRVP